MSRKPSGSRRWKRYQPPQQPRTEDGVRAGEPPAPPASAPAPRRRPTRRAPARPAPAKRSPAVSTAEKNRSESRKAAWIGGLSTLVVIVVVAALAAAQDDSDSLASSGIERDTLSVPFITRALANARTEQGDTAIGVQLSEYGLSVDYFDAAQQKIRTVETDGYSERYTVRVQDNYYEEYQPRPFGLALIDPATLKREAERALAAAKDPYRFEVAVATDRESGKVVARATASGDEDAERELVIGDAAAPVSPVVPVPGASGAPAQ